MVAPGDITWAGHGEKFGRKKEQANRAAEWVMNHATKAMEIEDIEARVVALEQATQNNPTDEGHL